MPDSARRPRTSSLLARAVGSRGKSWPWESPLLKKKLRAYEITCVWNVGVLKSSSVCFSPLVWMSSAEAAGRSVSRDGLESPNSRETRGDSQPSEEDRKELGGRWQWQQPSRWQPSRCPSSQGPNPGSSQVVRGAAKSSGRAEPTVLSRSCLCLGHLPPSKGRNLDEV